MGADGEAFGYRLRTYRLAADLSQRGLAQRSGLSIRTISDLERGRTRWPYPHSLSRLADALKLDGQPRLDFIAAAGRRLAGGGDGGSRRPVQAPVPRQLPAPAPAFAGRAGQLAALSRLLDQPGGLATISAIGGMPGVGKTALALQWAHQVATSFPDGQLYVNLRGFDPLGPPVTAAEAVRGFLDALGVPGDQLPGTTEAHLGLYRSLLVGKRVLVVLDNARDAAQVRPLLPGSPTCRVVVTSRNQLAGLAAIEAARPLVLDVLTDAEARQLLASRLGEARIAADPAAVAQIIDACAHLPLALSVVAARAGLRPRLSLSHVAAELTGRSGLRGLADAGGTGGAVGAAGPVADVRAAFSWSYRQLGQLTARVFRLVSLHPGPSLEPTAVAALTGVTAGQATRELEALVRVSLVQTAGPRRYGLHDLLRGYARELAGAKDSDADQRAALTSLLDYFVHAAALAMDAAFPAERYRRPAVSRPSALAAEFVSPAVALAWLGAERANLVAAVVYADGHDWPGQAVRLAETLFRYLDTDAQFADAVTVYDSAGRSARAVGDRVAEATSLLNLGNIYLHEGRYRQGTDSFGRALALGHQSGDLTGQARALAGLGLGELLLGRPGPATGHIEESLALYTECGDVIGQARALGNLGFAAMRQGRYADAAEHLRESLRLCQAAADRRGEARALANLGEIELRQHRYEQAASYLRDALEGFGQVGDRISAADTLASLGLVELRQDRPVQATEHLSQALTICREAGDVPRQALALNGLGEVLQAMGKPAQARSQHAAALKLATQAGEKYEQARAHAGLAAVYQASGVAAKARRHWTEALSRYEDLGAPEAEHVRLALAT
jgi:tetratricopeptide (TPR) repeat protein